MSSLRAFIDKQGGGTAGAPADPPPNPPRPPRDPREPREPREPRSRRAATKRRTKGGREQLLVYLFPAGIKELKLAKVEYDRDSVSEIVAEAVNAWLVQHGRPPVA